MLMIAEKIIELVKTSRKNDLLNQRVTVSFFN